MIKQPPVMQLPAEQQALLLSLLPELRRMATTAHFRYCNLQELYGPEDILQDSLARMYAAARYPPAVVQELKSWAYTIMKNRAVQFSKRSRDTAQGALAWLAEMEYYALPEATEDKVAYLHRMAKKHLRPVVQQVLYLYGSGQSQKEVAVSLNLPAATVRTHVHTAKKVLGRLSANSV